MMNSTFTEREIRTLAHADALGVLADVLRGPGNAQLSPEQAADLLRAAGWTQRQPLAAHWLELSTEVSGGDRQAWSIEHHRLFEGATVCPLNQCAYVRRDKGVILGDLCGFYRAFGLQPRSNCGEKPDHLVTELEFLSLLLVMRAQSPGSAPPERRQVVDDAARSFATDHLSEWLGAAAAHLRRTTPLPLLRGLANALESTWAALAEDHGWPPLTPGLDVDADLEPPSDDCGSIGSPVPVLTVAGRPLAQSPQHSQEC